VPLGKYVADFACHYPKLVVELDGDQHAGAKKYDEERTYALNSHGFEVLRFWNSEVHESIEGVVDRIRHAVRLPTAFDYAHLKKSQTPTPTLPSRGRE
jgi:very-short-patch-repair endonuclease